MNSPYEQLKLAKETAKLKPAPTSGGGGGANGRPAGSKAPQTTKRVKPMRAFSLSKIKDNMIVADKLQTSVVEILTKSLNKPLDETQLGIAKEISHVIIANEKPDEWIAKINDYIENPTDRNQSAIEEIREIGIEHNIEDSYLASILYHSKTNVPE
jgi:hypothetical protein